MSSLNKTNEEKTFKHFMKIPPELRMMFINKMQADDRCNLAGVSKIGNAEAKASKNYLHRLKICIYNKNHVNISVVFCPFEHNKSNGFSLIFKKENSKKYMRYVRSGRKKELWKIELKTSMDIIQVAMEHFRKYAQPHQTGIKEFSIESLTAQKFELNFDITSSNRLQKLTINEKCGYSNLIPEIRHPLK